MLTVNNQKPFLVLDAAMPDIQVALLGQNGCLASFSSREPALESLYLGVENCLRIAQCELKDIGGFIYCEGPGGTLGLRVVAMTLRSWRVLDAWKHLPLYSYNAFAAASAFVEMTMHSVIDNTLFLCEIGKDKVYGVKGRRCHGEVDVTLISSGTLSQHSGDVYWLPQRKIWNVQSSDVRLAHYSIEKLSSFFYDAKCLKKVEEPHLWHFENQTFKKWDAKPHASSS